MIKQCSLDKVNYQLQIRCKIYGPELTSQCSNMLTLLCGLLHSCKPGYGMKQNWQVLACTDSEHAFELQIKTHYIQKH